jgi:tRNA (guanine37-N1)-methyltransferase
MALEKTLRNRPELLERISLSDEDQEILDELRFLHGDIED